MSTAEPTEEETAQTRNKKAFLQTVYNGQMENALGSAYFCGQPGEYQNGTLYCSLCAVWRSTKGAILKDHVLRQSKEKENP